MCYTAFTCRTPRNTRQNNHPIKENAMQLIVTNGQDARFVKLCEQLDAYLDNAVGGRKNRQQYEQYNGLDDIHDVILVMQEQVAVGCGGFKKYSDGVSELKRIYIRDDQRGKGYGAKLVSELERLARQQGYLKMILETGYFLTNAQKMYHSLGYKTIPNYGQYADMEASICMEKAFDQPCESC